MLILTTPRVERIPRLEDSLVEESSGLGGEDVVGAAHGASALAKDGHVPGVSSKLADILLNPNKGLPLVPQTLKRKSKTKKV